MSRSPSPWRRNGAGGAWYAQVKGRKVRLAGPEATKDEARRVLIGLLAGRPVDDARPPAPSVRDVCNLFYVEREKRAGQGRIGSDAMKGYLSRLGIISDEFGDLAADRLTPSAVEEWAAGKPWSPSYARLILTTLICAVRSAVKAGRLEADPLKGVKRPRNTRREFDATEDVRTKILDAVDGRFRDFILACAETGCRPIEVARATAADFDETAGTLTVRNKTRHATGQETRTIYLSPTAAELVARLAAEHPEGLLFRNRDGRQWSPNTWSKRFARLKRVIGLPEACSLYTLRHAFITDAVALNISPLVIAELAGHTSIHMVMTHYSKIARRRDTLRDAVAKVRPKREPEDG